MLAVGIGAVVGGGGRVAVVVGATVDVVVDDVPVVRGGRALVETETDALLDPPEQAANPHSAGIVSRAGAKRRMVGTWQGWGHRAAERKGHLAHALRGR